MQALEDPAGAVAILDRGGADPHDQQEPDRVYHDVALAAIDLLAGVIPARLRGDGVRTLRRACRRGGDRSRPGDDGDRMRSHELTASD